MTKVLKLENLTALILSAAAILAMYIAQTSSYACVWWAFEQPKMPKSLIRKD